MSIKYFNPKTKEWETKEQKERWQWDVCETLATNFEIIPCEGLPPGSILIMAGPLFLRHNEDIEAAAARAMEEGRILLVTGITT